MNGKVKVSAKKLCEKIVELQVQNMFNSTPEGYCMIAYHWLDPDKFPNINCPDDCGVTCNEKVRKVLIKEFTKDLIQDILDGEYNEE